MSMWLTLDNPEVCTANASCTPFKKFLTSGDWNSSLRPIPQLQKYLWQLANNRSRTALLDTIQLQSNYNQDIVGFTVFCQWLYYNIAVCWSMILFQVSFSSLPYLSLLRHQGDFGGWNSPQIMPPQTSTLQFETVKFNITFEPRLTKNLPN